MNALIKKDLLELSDLATANCNDRGTELVAAGEVACVPITLWLQYLYATQITGTADCLIAATASAVHEGIACITLGLVRPALNSIRLQIDLVLAWLYFKDHPIEWKRVQDTGDGFKMKSEVLKYLDETVPEYKTRFAMLLSSKCRLIDEPYRLLSAHIHGQSESTLPQVQKPKDIIASQKTQNEAIQLQGECSEYVNDVLWSVFSDRWASVPQNLTDALMLRLTPKQKAAFFQ